MHDMKPMPETARKMVERCVCAKVRAAARYVTASYDDALRPTGLRATQLAVLAAVGAGNSSSITAVSELLGMDRSTLSRNVSPLQRRGLVRVGTEGWRRSRALEITKKGRLLLAKAVPLWETAQEGLHRKLGYRDWAQLNNSLTRLLSPDNHQT
jgi:DNA-binding MarR family transcriptional regulator